MTPSMRIVGFLLVTSAVALRVPPPILASSTPRRAILAVGISIIAPFPRPAPAVYDCKWSPDECARREAGSVYLSSGVGAAAAATRAKLAIATDTLKGIEPLIAAGKLAQAENLLASGKLAEFSVLLSRLAGDDASTKAGVAEVKRNFVGLVGALKQRKAPSAQVYYDNLMVELDKL